MKLVAVCFFISTIFLGSAFSKQIPSYLKKCSSSDPKLTECIINNGNAAIPYITKGDPKYGIPSFRPLKLDKVDFNAGTLQIKFSKISVYGFEDFKVIDANINTKNDTMYLKIEVPEATMKSNYVAKGKILVLPIEGSGPSTISLYDGKIEVFMNFENFSPDSDKPIAFKGSVVKYVAADSKYNFENLFNGNKELGDQVNTLLNENHAILYQEFHPLVAELVNTIGQSIFNAVLDNFYFKDVFLP